jgi:hypothetical protein
MPSQVVSVEGGVTTPSDHIFQHLKSGATFDASGDYSSTVEKFTFVVPSGREAEIERMLIYIEDAGAPTAGKYGYNIVLANGIKAYIRDSNDDAIIDLTPDRAVFTNADWAALCFDVAVLDWGVASSVNTVAVRWTFAKSGAPLYLKGRDGHYLSVELNDDFTGLLSHRFLIQGIYRK